MPEYKIEQLETAGHKSSPPEIIDCGSDADALAHARQKLDGHNLQVWQGARLLTSLKSLETPAGSDGLTFESEMLIVVGMAYDKIIAVLGDTKKKRLPSGL